MIWKQPKCPRTDEWITKMYYIHTLDYYLALKRNPATSNNVNKPIENIMQSEINHLHDKYMSIYTAF